MIYSHPDRRPRRAFVSTAVSGHTTILAWKVAAQICRESAILQSALPHLPQLDETIRCECHRCAVIASDALPNWASVTAAPRCFGCRPAALDAAAVRSLLLLLLVKAAHLHRSPQNLSLPADLGGIGGPISRLYLKKVMRRYRALAIKTHSSLYSSNRLRCTSSCTQCSLSLPP